MICYLIRHGKDDNSVRGGWSDSPLTDEGILQVKRLSEKILSDDQINIGKIYTSDLPRARQTAEILSEALSIPMKELPEFRETNNGVLAGMDHRLAEKQFPGLYWSALDWDEPYPNGESPCQFYNRISEAWNHFKKEIQRENPGVALVTHGGVINVIQCIEKGIAYSNKANPFPIGNAEIINIETQS